jgi:DNA modification methylase
MKCFSLKKGKRMKEMVFGGCVFSRKYFEGDEPSTAIVQQRIEQVRCGVEPQILIDEDLNVLDGLVDLRAAIEVPRCNPTFMILPGRSELQKQAIVQMLHPVAKSAPDSPAMPKESSAVVQVSQQDCLDFAARHPISKRSAASPAQRLLIVARGIKELMRVLDALKKIDSTSLPNKKMTVHQLERKTREYQARQLAAKGPRDITLGKVRLFSGDFRTVDTGLNGNEVECVFTDPPYDRESIELYYESGLWSRRFLKPGGLYVAYTGTLYMPEIHEALRRAGLVYVWEAVIVHNGGHKVSWPTRTICGHKKILIYQKPPKGASWKVFLDTYTQGRQEQDLHPWQQCRAEAEYFIHHLVKPGSLVADMFMGSGTTIVAAINCGMNAIGIEKDPVTYEVAQRRIEDHLNSLSKSKQI